MTNKARGEHIRKFVKDLRKRIEDNNRSTKRVVEENRRVIEENKLANENLQRQIDEILPIMPG